MKKMLLSLLLLSGLNVFSEAVTVSDAFSAIGVDSLTLAYSIKDTATSDFYNAYTGSTENIAQYGSKVDYLVPFNKITGGQSRAVPTDLNGDADSVFVMSLVTNVIYVMQDNVLVPKDFSQNASSLSDYQIYQLSNWSNTDASALSLLGVLQDYVSWCKSYQGMANMFSSAGIEQRDEMVRILDYCEKGVFPESLFRGPNGETFNDLDINELSKKVASARSDWVAGL